MEHRLKTNQGSFGATCNGLKQYSVRKFDRDFNVGDTLWLLEIDSSGHQTGDRIVTRITHITPPGEYGLPNDVGVIGFGSFQVVLAEKTHGF